MGKNDAEPRLFFQVRFVILKSNQAIITIQRSPLWRSINFRPKSASFFT
jgi:hypothetical protein